MSGSSSYTEFVAESYQYDFQNGVNISEINNNSQSILIDARIQEDPNNKSNNTQESTDNQNNQNAPNSLASRLAMSTEARRGLQRRMKFPRVKLPSNTDVQNGEDRSNSNNNDSFISYDHNKDISGTNVLQLNDPSALVSTSSFYSTNFELNTPIESEPIITPTISISSKKKAISPPTLQSSISSYHSMNNNSKTMNKPPPAFIWPVKSPNPHNNPALLFIAHDNPQLAKSILAASGVKNMNKRASSNKQSDIKSIPRLMDVLIESHDGQGTTHMLMGSVIFAGDTEEIGFEEEYLNRVLDDDDEMFFDHDDTNNTLRDIRGSACLVVADLSAFKVDIKKLPRRVKGDIIELEIRPETAGHEQRSGESLAEGVSMHSAVEVDHFLSVCRQRVDVILDPINDGKLWYPYFETSNRKMAPQFRSRGVGYLRLGDDMSNFGVAFLSVDGGRTFLDHNKALSVSGTLNIKAVTKAGPSTASASSQRSLSSKSKMSKSFHGQRSKVMHNSMVNEQSDLDSKPLAVSESVVPGPLERQSSTSSISSIQSSSTITSAANTPSTRKGPFTDRMRKMIMKTRSESFNTMSALEDGRGHGSAIHFQEDGQQDGMSHDLSMDSLATDVTFSQEEKLPLAKATERFAAAVRNTSQAVSTPANQQNSSELKWSDKVAILQQLIQQTQTIFLSISSVHDLLEAFTQQYGNLASELLYLMSDMLSKQQNTNVTMTTLQCLITVVFVSPAFDTPALMMSMKQLLQDVFYLLRSNHKGVHFTAAKALEQGYRHKAFNLSMINALTSTILTGNISAKTNTGSNASSKLRPTKSEKTLKVKPSESASSATTKENSSFSTLTVTTAGNTNKVLNILQDLILIESEKLMNSKGKNNCSEGNGVGLELLHANLVSISKDVSLMLKHREEAVRDAAVSLLCHTIISEMMVLIMLSSSDQDRSIKEQVFYYQQVDLETFPKSFSSSLSETLMKLIRDIQADLPKVFSKLTLQLGTILSNMRSKIAT